MFLFALMANDISRSHSLPIIFCMSYLLTPCELHYLFPQKYDQEREKNKTCGEDFDILSTNGVKMTQSILGKTSQKDIALLKIPVFILDSFSCQLAKKDQIVEGGMMSLQRLSESLFKSPISKRATKTAFFIRFVAYFCMFCKCILHFEVKFICKSGILFSHPHVPSPFFCVCVYIHIRACRFRLWRV